MPLELRIASAGDEQRVQAIFEASPQYFRKIDGTKVGPHFARREMQDLPKQKSETYQKVFCIVMLDDRAAWMRQALHEIAVSDPQ
jgi:hypothetical protein